MVGNVESSPSNFTLVIIALRGSTSYADMRIIGPGMELAVAEVRRAYPALGFQVEIWNETFQDSCNNLEFNTANKAAETYYEKLNSSYPVSAFLGTTCTWADKQLLELLYSNKRWLYIFCHYYRWSISDLVI